MSDTNNADVQRFRSLCKTMVDSKTSPQDFEIAKREAMELLASGAVRVVRGGNK